MSYTEVFVAYAAKVLFGCVYGYVFLHYYDGDDTWQLHANSLKETQMLLDRPYQFFWEFTPMTALRNGNGGLRSIGFYLHDLEYCLQAKTLGIINLVSRGNYYINVVFWNFLLFWGPYWLFSLLAGKFPEKRKIFFFVIFLFPPSLFWLSGLRADGLLFLFFSLSVVSFHKLLSVRQLSATVPCGIGFLGILIFRAPLAVLLLPAFTGWWISAVFPGRPWIHYTWIYATTAIVFFTSVATPFNLPERVAARQAEFLKLSGTAFRLDELSPSISSFARVFPQSVINTFFRPAPWEAKGTFQLMAALEVLVFWAFVVFVLVARRRFKGDPPDKPFILFMVFFGVSLYILIGYIVPFPGAIVRYKIIAELCLLLSLSSLVPSGEIKH